MIRSTFRTTFRNIHQSARVLAKGDVSTIDSYKLPSQTSINEWEFKYDFVPKTAEPKVPPITKEAVKQDIAHERAKQVATEMFVKESNSSVKVEANSADVVHGGESVSEEPEFLQDRGSNPVDVAGAGAAKRSKTKIDYVQSSLNPNINKTDAINLGTSDVENTTADMKAQTPVVEDLEHDNLHHHGQEQQGAKKGPGLAVPLVVLGLGGGGYYYYLKENA